MAATPLDTLPDAELWALLRAGDERAFQELHTRHYRVLFRYGHKIHPDKEAVLDCLQDVYCQLWQRRDALAEVRSVRYYLMKWLKRELLRVLAKDNGKDSLPDEESPLVALEADDLFERGQEDDQRKALIKRALDELSPREREVIYLRFFMELTYDEICQVLNLAYQVVMNYLSRGLKALRASPILSRLLVTTVVFLKKSALYWLVGA